MQLILCVVPRSETVQVFALWTLLGGLHCSTQAFSFKLSLQGISKLSVLKSEQVIIGREKLWEMLVSTPNKTLISAQLVWQH